MDAVQKRFEKWYKETHGEHLMGKDADGRYVTAHCQWVYEGFKGAIDCFRHDLVKVRRKRNPITPSDLYACGIVSEPHTATLHQ